MTQVGLATGTAASAVDYGGSAQNNAFLRTAECAVGGSVVGGVGGLGGGCRTTRMMTGLQEANQLTWFRFRHFLPCVVTALTYRMCITNDDVIQVEPFFLLNSLLT